MKNTCGGCATEWTGTRIAHCAAPGCHETFSTVANFDVDRVAGECARPEECGLRVNEAGVWVSTAERPRFWEKKA